jgi:uncharacterized protein with NRDE domain
MCLILLAYECHPAYRLIIAANRDEFFARPTAPAAFWDDAPQLLAGRDLQEGGTWLGITRNGRFAALTNYRDPASYRQDRPSRGRLVSDFLRGNMSTSAYREFLQREGDDYNNFNLIFGTSEELCCFSNRGNLFTAPTPGIHGLSNHLLDTPWPKVSRGREALARLIAPADTIATDDIFTLLADRTPAPDYLLPDTGVGIERERLLSPLFISTPAYGTRSSTVVLIDRNEQVTFSERTFHAGGEKPRTVIFRFRIESRTEHY